TTSLCPLNTSRSPTPRKTKSLPPLSAPSSQFQLDSDSSEEEEDDAFDEEASLSIPPLSPVDSCCSSEFECNHPTMWLGTEDGCIHVYNCYDNIRTKKNKIKIQLTAAVNCIIYLNNQVFGGLSNGQIAVFRRDETGNWLTNEPKIIEISTNPVVKLLAVSGKLWCAVQNQVSVLTTCSLETEISFQVNIDMNRVILCMVASGLGVWISTQSSPIIKLYHGKSFECLLEINIAPAVSKILATACDDIIRQHKAACLRVTTLLTCKDLLWIGTSAGTVLTMPLPHLTASTSKVENVPSISGIPQGHTGHVRFLTTVQFNSNTTCLRQNHHDCTSHCHSMKKDRNSAIIGKQTAEESIMRSGSNPTISSKILVISGGDGYEDFTNYGINESVGRDDSTNHILLWQV
ncbi:Rho guanine nucleotide exchange factor 17-like protein, partial [Leptotrombidium deliense]